MTKVQELNNSKKPIVSIDPSLNKYRDNTLFPEKLALANEQLKGVRLPRKNSDGVGTAKSVPGKTKY